MVIDLNPKARRCPPWGGLFPDQLRTNAVDAFQVFRQSEPSMDEHL